MPPKDDDQPSNPKLLDVNCEMGYYNSKDEFCIRFVEVPRIQNHFNILYVNRLQNEGRKLDQKKQHKVIEESKKNTFKPKIDQSSETLALQRKKKVAVQLGIDVDEVEARNIDPVEFLRAQGQLTSMTKEQRA